MPSFKTTADTRPDHLPDQRVLSWLELRQVLARPLSLAQPVQLHLVRHGETVTNAQGLVTGSQDVPLTAVGEDQARRIGHLLDRHYDLALHSTLSRSLHTLRLALEAGRINVERIRSDPRDSRICVQRMKEKVMSSRRALSIAFVGLVSLCPFQTNGEAQEKPAVQIPKPGVPEVLTMEAKFVRAAYNREGYVILGYQASNRSIGDEWMLLEVGMTVLDNVPDYTLKREALSLETPDGKTIPLATVEEQREGNPQAIQQRAKVQRDSINYFPTRASRPCAILFFPELGSRALPYDQVDLSNDRACLGRLYFKIPGGIAYGQHWLNVKFEKSLVRVPFRILTQDEEKLLSKNYKSIEKQVKEAFAPKKK